MLFITSLRFDRIKSLKSPKGAAFDMRYPCFFNWLGENCYLRFSTARQISRMFFLFFYRGSFGAFCVQVPATATFTPFVCCECRRLGAVQRLLAPELKGGDAAAEKQAGHLRTEALFGCDNGQLLLDGL